MSSTNTPIGSIENAAIFALFGNNEDAKESLKSLGLRHDQQAKIDTILEQNYLRLQNDYVGASYDELKQSFLRVLNTPALPPRKSMNTNHALPSRAVKPPLPPFHYADTPPVLLRTNMNTNHALPSTTVKPPLPPFHYADTPPVSLRKSMNTNHALPSTGVKPPLPPRKEMNPHQTSSGIVARAFSRTYDATLLGMPFDLLDKIFSYLPVKDLFRIPCASKVAKEICAYASDLWQKLHERHFPARQRIAPPSDFLQACSDAYRTRRNFLASQFTVSEFDGFVKNETACFTASDGKLILSSIDNKGEFYIWDLKTGKYSTFSDPNLGPVTSLRAHDGKLYVATSIGTIAIWDLQENKYLSSLQSDNDRVDLFEIYDGMLYAGSTGGTIQVWDLKEETCLSSFKAPESSITSFTAHNGKLYLGDASGIIHIWDATTGECLGTIEAHPEEVSSLVICDGKLYSGSPEITHRGVHSLSYGPIKIWDLETFKCLGTLTKYPDGSAANMYDDEERSSLFMYEGHLCSHSDGKITIWDLEECKRKKTFDTGCKNINSFATVDGKLCVITHGWARDSIKVLDFTPQKTNFQVCLDKVIPLKKMEPVQQLASAISSVREVWGGDSLSKRIKKETSKRFSKLPVEAQRGICQELGFSGNFDSEPARYSSLFYNSSLTQKQQLVAIEKYRQSLIS